MGHCRSPRKAAGICSELLPQANLQCLQAPGSHEGQQDYRRIYRKVRRGVLRKEGEAVFVLLLMFTLRGEPMTLEIPQPDYQTCLAEKQLWLRSVRRREITDVEAFCVVRSQ